VYQRYTAGCSKLGHKVALRSKKVRDIKNHGFEYNDRYTKAAPDNKN